MLILIFIIAFILLLITVLVVFVRKNDANAYTDQERDPFEVELARLAAAGLLYEEQESNYGRSRKSYTITPAGEAALRTWLREPMNDPGMLRLYFAGIVAPSDVLSLAREQAQSHEARLDEFRRVEALLEGQEEWEEARKIAKLGREFEEHCSSFWQGQTSGPIRGRSMARGSGAIEDRRCARDGSKQGRSDEAANGEQERSTGRDRDAA